jgi:hypothetical protein
MVFRWTSEGRGEGFKSQSRGFLGKDPSKELRRPVKALDLDSKGAAGEEAQALTIEQSKFSLSEIKIQQKSEFYPLK